MKGNILTEYESQRLHVVAFFCLKYTPYPLWLYLSHSSHKPPKYPDLHKESPTNHPPSQVS